jgi:hypothetical protein
LAFIDFEKYDLILHEAGIPPIHTPMSILGSLSEKVKAKMYLYHCCSKDVPENMGL